MAGAQEKTGAGQPPVQTTASAKLRANYARLPLHFEPNQGQAGPHAQFLARGPDHSLSLNPTVAALTFGRSEKKSPATLRMRLVAANPEARGTGLDRMTGKASYFRGGDPKRWHTGIPMYGRVSYAGVYPGIDLVYYGSQRRLAYDFVVAPGADPARIALEFTGAERIKLDAGGDLVFSLNGDPVRWTKPVVYQRTGGKRVLIPSRYVLQGDRVRFQVGAYDETKPLIIDPTLVYSTLFGGSGSQAAYAIALDGQSNAYITGYTQDPNFGPSDAFVAKLNAAGTALLYSATLGGTGYEVAHDTGVDGQNSAYVTGHTSSSQDFPITSGAYQVLNNGSTDAFVTKLDYSGALAYSTYLGGIYTDSVRGIAVNANGSFTYTPGANFAGTDRSTYHASDGTANSNTATVTLSVNAVADPPDAVDDFTRLLPGQGGEIYNIRVLDNDTDPNGDPLTVISVTQGTSGFGFVRQTPSNGLYYNYYGDFFGMPFMGDSFTYTISDGHGGTDTATVFITTQNNPPFAVDDFADATNRTRITIPVLANDYDGDTDRYGDYRKFTITGVTQGAHGTAEVVDAPLGFLANQAIVYTPGPGFTGTDQFTYTITDLSGASATATVFLEPQNHAPVAQDDQDGRYGTDLEVFRDGTLFFDPVSNDTDTDDDPLTITGFTQPAHGTVATQFGTRLLYTPQPGYIGPDEFTYTISDGRGGTDTATVRLLVVNPYPSITTISPDSVAEDGPAFTLTVNGINSTEFGFFRSFVPTSRVYFRNVELATTYVSPTQLTAVVPASLLTEPGRVEVYVWNPRTFADLGWFFGSNTVFLTVTETPSNRPPDARDDAATTDEDTPVNISVLANDTDPDPGTTLRVTGVTQGQHGSVAINANNTVRYTPTANYFGTDTFTYTVDDGTGRSDTATVTVTIRPVNDPPLAANDSYSVDRLATLTVPAPGVLGNDTDVEGSPLSASRVSGPSHGALTLSSSGSFTYTPNRSFFGTDSFTYRAHDGTAFSNTATVTLTVNNAPVPDLQIPAAAAPEETLTDRAFDLSWTDANTGDKRAQGPWVDRVYLSSDAQPGNDQHLADFSFGLSLAPGQSVGRIQAVSIPRAAVPTEGVYYLLIVTDSNDAVIEGNENNNFRAVPITVRRTPLPDLIVSSIEAPDTAFFDQTITVRWTVQNAGVAATDAAEWRDYLYLSADRSIGNDALQLDVENVSYLNAGESYIASAEVRIPRGVFGNYYLIVKTDVNNAVFENNEDNNTRDRAISIQVPLVPDLQVSLVQTPEETFSGQSIPISWRVENRGTGNTPPDQSAWLDGVYLSLDTTLDPSVDPFLGEQRREGGLPRDGSYTVNGLRVEIPANIAGDWYVFVVTDYKNNVYEFTNESNNANYTRARPLRVRGTPADLVVTAVSAPVTGTAGRPVTVSWTVRNQGAFNAGPNWFDTVYLSTDATLDPEGDTALATVFRNSGLAPGGSYSASSAVATLPACQSGAYTLYVVTDRYNQIFELDPSFDAEANNVSAARTIQIAQNPPDLQVTEITNPSVGNAGQPVSITWTVTNNGSIPTVEGSWTDRVYLSESPTFNASAALRLGSFTRSGDLAPGVSYTLSEEVTIPSTAQGTYHVFVWTDAGDRVEECDREDNNVAGGSVTTNVNNDLPDLIIAGVEAPANAFAGQTIPVRWTGGNAGSVAARSSAWVDTVYLSSDDTLDAGDRILAIPLIRGPLAVGGSYNEQAQVLLPFLPAGTYYLIVRADSNNNVFEGRREDNNTGNTAIALTIPDVDLQVTSVDAPAEAFSGQEMPVSWTVTNAATMPTFASNWTDYVLLSRDQVLDPTDRIIGYKTRNSALDAGASYTATLDAPVPAGLTGPYYLFVRADWHNAVGETNEFNNVGGPDGVLLQLPPPVDLTVAAIDAPATGSPGETATIRWTGKNIGKNTATGRWGDAVYLSRDRVWDIDDALVGRIDIAGPLPAGGTYAGTLTADLPAVDPGSYYVLVRTDVRNRVREDDETNNTTATAGAMAVDVVELQLGVARASTLRTGQERHFKVNAPGSETLLFTLDAQNNDSVTELFARYGRIASRSAFDFLFSRPYDADQEIIVPDTLSGFYYGLARGAYVAGVTPITIKAEIIPFSIRSVRPSRIGDNGQVTLTLRGAKFRDGATVTLAGNGVTLTAASVQVLDSATLKARFFFTNAPRGVYDVAISNPGGATAAAPRAVTMEAATGMLLDFGVTGDTQPRAGRSASSFGLIRNRGNVDLTQVYVLTEVGGRAVISTQRPEDSLPRKSDFPDADWINAPPTNTETDAGTTDYFVLKDVAPGEERPFTVTINQVGADPFPMTISAVPVGGADQEALLREGAEELRQAILRGEAPLADPAGRAALSSQAAWWAYFRSQMAAAGFLEPGGGQSGGLLALALPPGARPVNGLFVGPAQANQTCAATCLGWFLGGIAGCNIGLVKGAPLGMVAVVGWVACKAVVIGKYICCLQDCSPPPPPEKCSPWRTFICGVLHQNGTLICPTRPSDPNDKIGPTGFGPQAFAGVQQPWPYTVNFENVPTASAAAQRVRITDQLDPNLDWRTFRLKEIGFGSYRIPVPENRAFFQDRIELGEDLGSQMAEISAGIDIATGQVTWTLTMIDPKTGEQPNSALLGLLPPNDESGRGQGFVTYTIQPRADAPTGTQIANSATITFDTEESIVTNTVSHAVDAEGPTSAVAPLPAVSPRTFIVRWSGEDVGGGSELQNFDVWVSENDGAYRPLLTGTTDTSAEFAGQPGRRYRFYSIARDNAGNVEVAPETPDAVTTIDPVQPNPAPILTGLTPGDTAAGGGQFPLTVSGENFVSGSVVRWNGQARPTTFVSSTLLTATIPAADIAHPGSAVVTVENPAPGGGPSNALTFAIRDTSAPRDTTPPSSAVAALPAQTNTLSFTVSWSGSDEAGGSGLKDFDVYVSDNNGAYTLWQSAVTATSATYTGVAGHTYRFYSIARDNAGNVEAAPATPDAVTTLAQVTQNPIPTLSSLSPNSANAGGEQFTLTVTGTNFMSGSVVQWNGLPRTTTFVSATELTATILASDIASVGIASVTAVNPAPGGGTSNALAFTINTPTARDVSRQVQVIRGGFRLNRATNRFVQQVTLRNTGGSTITGPISLVLDNLSANAALFNQAGLTNAVPPAGSPYFNAEVGSLAPDASVSLVLEFTNPTNTAISYSTRVLAGAGGR